MAQVDITPVESGADRRAFLILPERLYSRDPNFVCPLRIERRDFLDRKKNPFFDNAEVQLFLARKEDRVAGRISAHIYHPHNRTHHEKTGFFGFFECEHDYDIAKALLDAARDWLEAHGMDRMRGPASFTLNHDMCGFLVDGFESPPVIMMSYNPSFYHQFAERYGLVKAMDFYAYHMTDETPFTERGAKLIERIRSRAGVTIRTLDMKQFDKEVALVKMIFDTAWANNWGYVAMTDAEIAHMAKDLRQIVDPRIVLFAEVDGKPVGFSLAVPDINQALIHLHGRLFPFGLIKLLWLLKVKKVCNRVRVMVMGVLPEYQKRGIDVLLNYETYTRGTAVGYNEAEMSWVLETNTEMNAVAAYLGSRKYKTYRMYDLPIGGD